MFTVPPPLQAEMDLMCGIFSICLVAEENMAEAVSQFLTTTF